MAFLGNTGNLQTQLALALGGTQLGQANRDRDIRLKFIFDLLNSMREERLNKKNMERQKKAQRQQSAIDAGAILATVLTGGAAAPSLGASSLMGAKQQFSAGNPNVDIDTFLKLLGS